MTGLFRVVKALEHGCGKAVMSRSNGETASHAKLTCHSPIFRINGKASGIARPPRVGVHRKVFPARRPTPCQDHCTDFGSST